MVSDFHILSDCMTMFLEGRLIFITHGDIYNKDNMPKLNNGDILIHGHTHIPAIEDIDGKKYINPGSISLPKNNTENSYMVYENGKFEIKDFEGNKINEYIL